MAGQSVAGRIPVKEINVKPIKINKGEIEVLNLAALPSTSLNHGYFEDKRLISKQLSDQKDEQLLNDITKEQNRAIGVETIIIDSLNAEVDARIAADEQERAERIEADEIEAEARIAQDKVLENAIVKSLTQNYDHSTGVLRTVVAFNNANGDSIAKDPISVETQLDIEKYILNIEDVWCTKKVVDGKDVYTEVPSPTAEQLEQTQEYGQSTYIKCLKVTYDCGEQNSDGTGGDITKVVYFEVDDIFASIIHKVDALQKYLNNNTRTITLKDAAGKTLLSFRAFAPNVGTSEQTAQLGNITLGEITVI
ncbi:MAG: hypothetical protein HUJ68_04525 [Clostridia bacterium]|nr:hypothetical protein [Clostridia bacterium]